MMRKTGRIARAGFVIVVMLIAGIGRMGGAGPVAAQTPNTDGEVLTYGVDALPDRVRDFHLRTVAGGDDAT